MPGEKANHRTEQGNTQPTGCVHQQLAEGRVGSQMALSKTERRFPLLSLLETFREHCAKSLFLPVNGAMHGNSWFLIYG